MGIGKRFNRLVSLVMALAMALTLLPVSALAEGTRVVTFRDSEAFGYTLLSVQRVSQGSAAVAPAAPRHEGFRFAGWDKDFSLVEADLTVTATYREQCALTPGCTLANGHEGDCDFTGGTTGGGVRPEGAFRVDFLDWDGTPIETQYILAGEDAAAPQPPTRAGFRFLAWDTDYTAVAGDLTVTATYAPLDAVLITINYFDTDNTIVAIPYVAQVKKGDPYQASVPSPTVPGYAPDQAAVVIDEAAVSQDLTYNVFYTPADTDYEVWTYLEDLTEGSYTFRDKFDGTAKTGSTVTADTTKTYTGFTLPKELPTAVVAADGSTVLKVEYTRNSYEVAYDTQGGSYIAPAYVKFGAAYTLADEPTRFGYAFDGWTAEPDTLSLSGSEETGYVIPAMPASDVTLTAAWTGEKAAYTVIIWQQDVEGNGYSVKEVITDRAKAATGSMVSPNNADRTKAYTGFHYNEEKSVPVKVQGNGSTELNVYYDRDIWTVKFWVRKPENNGDYSSSNDWQVLYTKSGRFASKLNFWPEISVMDDYYDDRCFDGWNREKGGRGTTLTYLELFHDGNTTMFSNGVLDLYGQFASNEQTQRNIVHYVQTLDGTWEKKYTAVSFSSGNFTINNRFEGFTASEYRKYYEDWFNVKKWSNWSGVTPGATSVSSWLEIEIHHARNSYSLKVYNGTAANLLNSDSVPFEQALSGYRPAADPTVRPSGIPANYVFKGWYTSQGGYDGSEMNWAGTMPAADMIVYGVWAPPSYTVTFDPNGGAPAVGSVTVSEGKTAAQPDAVPALTGYSFAGWHRKTSSGGVGARFSFETLIYENVELIAKWDKRQDVSLTVNHLFESDHSQAKPSENVAPNTTGDTVTVFAQGFYHKGMLYLPDHRSKSYVVTGDPALDQVTFYYAAAPGQAYQVVYKEKDGGFAAETVNKTLPANQDSASVTEAYKNFPGYYPDAYQKTLYLSRDTAENVITFLYRKNPGVGYTVEHYIQKLNGQGYELYGSAESGSDAVGITVSANPQSITGFTYQPSLSAASVVLTSNLPGNVMRLYYTRDRFNVGFIVASGQESLGALTGKTAFAGYYGEKFYDAAVVPGVTDTDGYMFDKWTPALPGAGSTLSKDLTFEASFKEDPSEWFNVTYKANGGSGSDVTDRHLCLNSSYAVKANAFTRSNWDFIGWNTDPDGDGASYAESQQITVQGELILYAQWKEHDQFSVSYIGNAPSGSTAMGSTATQTDYENKTVSIAANGYSVFGYDFVKWNTASDGSGTDYTPGGNYTLTADLELYAQWAKDPELWYQLTYHANNGTGTLPKDGKEYLSGSKAAVLGGDGLTRTGYEFIGWSLSRNPAQGAALYQVNHELTMDGDKTLYAQWEASEYTISYVITSQLGSDKAPASHQVRFGAAIDLKAAANIPGYTFVGWLDGNGDPFALTQMPAGDITVYGYYEANTNTPYTVEHYVMDTAGSYPAAPTKKDDLTGTTGQPTGAALLTNLNSDGFTMPTLTQQTIAGDGSTVIQLYYARKQFTLTYEITGSYFADAAHSQEDYYYEAAVTALAKPTQTGHSFVGWTGEPAAMPAADTTVTGYYTVNSYTLTVTYVGPNDGTFIAPNAYSNSFSYGQGYSVSSPAVAGYTPDIALVSGSMPAQDYGVTVTYTANTNTPYTVEHYVMDTAGSYPAAPTKKDDLTGTTGQPTGAALLTNLNSDGFTMPALTQQTIAGDGSTVIQLYYARKQFTVTYVYGGTAPTGAPALPNSGNAVSFYFEQSVTAADNAALDGYTFSGWSSVQVSVAPGQSFNMPAQDVTIGGSFRADSATYTVEYWFETVDGKGWEKNDALTAGWPTGDDTYKTDEPVAFTAPSAPTGWVYDKTVKTPADGRIPRSGTLTIKVFYERGKFPYTVEYFMDGVKDAALTYTGTALRMGSTVTSYPDKLPAQGYKFTRDTLAGGLVIGAIAADNLIQVYYDKDSFGYSILYRDGSGAAVPGAPDAVGMRALYQDAIAVDGAKVTVGTAQTAHPQVTGYVYDAGATLAANNPAAISANGAGNVITVVYDKITYSLRYGFVDEGGNILSDAQLSAMGLSRPAQQAYQVDTSAQVAPLPTATGYEVSGWNTLQTMAGTDYPSGAYSVIPAGGVTFSTLWAKAAAKSYSLTYEITAPAKFASKTAPATVKYATPMTVAPNPSGAQYAGWTFSGWAAGNVSVAAGAYTMPDGDVAFQGSFTARTDTPYLVQYLFEDGAGSYQGDAAYPDVPGQGVTDQPAAYQTPDIPNFAFDHAEFVSVAGNGETPLQTAQVQGDGSLVIRLYYRIVRYAVNFTVYPHPAGSFNTPNSFTGLKYGDPMPAVPSYVINGGYEIDYWSILPSQMGSIVTGNLTVTIYCKTPDVTPGPGGVTPPPADTPSPTEPPVTTPQPSPMPSPVPTNTPAAQLRVEEDNTPLAAPESRAWALLNLILAVVTALVSLWLMLGIPGRRSRSNGDGGHSELSRKTGWRLSSLLPGIGGIVAFLLTENMADPMVWMDRWTLLMAAIALIQAGVALMSVKAQRDAQPMETGK